MNSTGWKREVWVWVSGLVGTVIICVGVVAFVLVLLYVAFVAACSYALRSDDIDADGLRKLPESQLAPAGSVVTRERLQDGGGLLNDPAFYERAYSVAGLRLGEVMDFYGEELKRAGWKADGCGKRWGYGHENYCVWKKGPRSFRVLELLEPGAGVQFQVHLEEQ